MSSSTRSSSEGKRLVGLGVGGGGSTPSSPVVPTTRPRAPTRSVSASQVPSFSTNCRRPAGANANGASAKGTGGVQLLAPETMVSLYAAASDLTRSMALEKATTTSHQSATGGSPGATGARSPRPDSSPPLPPHSTISAEEVIRESLASARSTAIYADQHDFQGFRRSDSFALSLSSRGTFRRSTVSEQMLRESEFYEQEREFSLHDLEILSSSAVHVKTMPMTSIKEEEQELKVEHAKSRWAQQVKLRARNFLQPVMGKGPVLLQPSSANPSGGASFASSAAQEWAAQQRIILSQLRPSEAAVTGGPFMASTNVLGSAPGAAKLHKWNRWMQEYFHGQQQGADRGGRGEGMNLSLEEVVSNPRMMRYYAAWLQDAGDQSKLFFLCSFEEYRQFWSTLRANCRQRNGANSAAHGASVKFTKDDILLLRTYGVKIATKYLANGAQFHIGADLVDSDKLRAIKRDIATGGEDALRTFDSIVSKVKRDLMATFPKFRETDLYAEMIRSVEREVIGLEDILMNQRMASFFWIFLFPHNYHREIAFWLDVEYEFKPAYREYITIAKAPNRRKEQKEQAARACRKLVRYICLKYYPGDPEMRQLDRSVSGSFARLQQEQDAIVAKFNLIHLELYHRFLTSRAHTEFSLYPSNGDDADAMDDLRRLSGLLLSYGLRAHHWPEEASREILRKRSLDVLQSARGYEAICGVLTFEATADADQAASGTASLRLLQHPLPHDPNPVGVDRAIESFLLPWCSDVDNVVVHSVTCPPPVAFNFKMGDSSSSNELYAACVVIYRPAARLPPSYFDKVRLDVHSGSRWVPYGVCILSRFPLVDLLRERLAEAYEFIIETEAISANRAKSGTKPPGASSNSFNLDKKLLSKLSRSVSFDSQSSGPVVLTPTSQSPTTALPRLDHSVRLAFDTLDIPTLLQVFTAVLVEQRILLVSSHLSVVMRVCESLRALMYPLLWPHVYLPILPRRMLQYLDCPTPFIFGVSKDGYQEARDSDLIEDEVLVVDLDRGAVVAGEIPCELPDSILFALREGLYDCLKPNVNRSDHVFAHRFPTHPFVFPDQAVRRVFYHAVQKLIGDYGYHRYIWTDEFAKKQTVFFDEASYLAASTPETREFRTLFSATQAFSEFMVSFHGFEEAMSRSSSSNQSSDSNDKTHKDV